MASSCLLYLVAAGLVARSVWYFEQGRWTKAVGKDVGERGAGPGSYDIDRSVWHVNVSSLQNQLLSFTDNVTVLQPRVQRRLRLGHLQRHPWMDQLGYLQHRHRLQCVLDRRWAVFHNTETPRSQGQLAAYEGQGNEGQRNGASGAPELITSIVGFEQALPVLPGFDVIV